MGLQLRGGAHGATGSYSVAHAVAHAVAPLKQPLKQPLWQGGGQLLLVTSSNLPYSLAGSQFASAAVGGGSGGGAVAGGAALLGRLSGLAAASGTRTRLLLTETSGVRVVDVTPGALPSAVVWPAMVPPAQAAASQLRGVVAAPTDGRFFIADKGAGVVWSLTIAPQVRCGSLFGSSMAPL